ncbi:MAG: amidohydrolase family protein [Colwellia sp.]|nr:amidohydrolase family protein [Colwellia sp.]
MLWASDSPHPDSVWPHARETIERQMGHLSPDLQRKATHDNASALLGWGELALV